MYGFLFFRNVVKNIVYFKIGTTAGTLEQITLIIGVIFAFLFGGWNDVLAALLVAQFLDTCTGLMVGATFKKLLSKRIKEGKWGNGTARYNRLKEVGYNPSIIQNRVNQLW